MTNPDEIIRQIWEALNEACADKKHPYNTAVLATVNSEGIPQQRTVVLRNVLQKKHVISCFTDWRSGKIKDMTANAHASWLFYDAQNKVQLRVTGTTKIHRQNEHTRQFWDKLSYHSRLAYLALPGPGSVTDVGNDGLRHLSKDMQTEYGYANFIIIKTEVSEIDWLWLSDDGHKRIRFTRNRNKWLAEGLIP